MSPVLSHRCDTCTCSMERLPTGLLYQCLTCRARFFVPYPPPRPSLLRRLARWCWAPLL